MANRRDTAVKRAFNKSAEGLSTQRSVTANSIKQNRQNTQGTSTSKKRGSSS